MNGLSKDFGIPVSAASAPGGKIQIPPFGRIPQSPVITIGFWLLAIELLISYSRFFDIFAAGYHIPAAVYGLLLLAIVASGAIPRALGNKTTTMAIAFTIWLGVTLPFSVWRTGSIVPAGRSIQCLILYVAVAGLVLTPRACTRMLYVLAFATFIGAVLGLAFGSMDSGRLELTGGSFADPNEYAMMVLLGLPLLLLLTRRKNPVLIAIGIGFAAANGLAFLRAGSRGGMIAFLIMCGVLFFSVSLNKKVMLVCVGAVVALLSLLVLPNYLKKRYVTFFSADEAALTQNEQERAMLAGADVASAENRFDLLVASLKLTAEHPLFGVGPGNFSTAYFDESAAKGIRVGWVACHNTYTQLSSETGVIGAGLFIAFLYRAFRALRHAIKRAEVTGQSEMAAAAYHLSLSFTAVVASAFFLSLGYSPIFYVLAGLSVALERAVLQLPDKKPLPAPRFAPISVLPSTLAPQADFVPQPRRLSGKAIRALMRKI